MLAGCGEADPTCKDGYALDNDGRCQLTSGGHSDGANTAPTAPSLRLQPEAK